MSVRTVSGALPPFDAALVLTGVERAKSEIRTELTQRIAADVARLDQRDEGFRARIAYLDSQAQALEAERDALAGGAGSGNGLPILGVVTLAVLAGAAAGFLTARLSGRTKRPETVIDLNPAPRTADPI